MIVKVRFPNNYQFATELKQKLIDKYNSIENIKFGECYVVDILSDAAQLQNVSHTIKQVKIIGNSIYANINILDKPAGKILMSYYMMNIPVEYIFRIVGVEYNNIIESGEIIAIDFKI